MAARSRIAVKPCASPGGNPDGERGRKLESEHSLNLHSVDISLNLDIPSSENSLPVYQLCLAPHIQTNSRGLDSHTGTPWHTPQLSTRFGPDSKRRNGHTIHSVRQTGYHPCDLTFATLLTDRSEPRRSLKLLLAGPANRRPKHQTYGLKLATQLEKGETPT
jgi:hypothetical protein